MMAAAVFRPSAEHLDATSRSEVTFSATAGSRGILGNGASSEDPTEFRLWSVFLPSVVSQEAERNTAYIKSRLLGNPRFFERMREQLESIMQDRDALRCVGMQYNDDGAAATQVLETIYQAQRALIGFVCDRQWHKAISLGKICVSLVNVIVETGGHIDLLFWQLICLVNLGAAYVRFAKYDEASSVLGKGLSLVQEAGDSLGAREQVLLGTIHSHLCNASQQTGDLDDAVRHADITIEIFERFVHQLSTARADGEFQAVVVASAYVSRGNCEIKKHNHDIGINWFTRAQECIDKLPDIGEDRIDKLTGSSDDVRQALRVIHERIEHVRALQV